VRIGVIVVGPCAVITGTGRAAYHAPPPFSALGMDGEIDCGLREYHEPPVVSCTVCADPLHAPENGLIFYASMSLKLST